jgi:hypothetical protein
LFGFRVEVEEAGSKCLVADPSTAAGEAQ